MIKEIGVICKQYRERWSADIGKIIDLNQKGPKRSSMAQK